MGRIETITYSWSIRLSVRTVGFQSTKSGSIPFEAFGSYQKVTDWLRLTDDQRRALLVQRGLVYTLEEEVMLALNGTTTYEPILSF